MVDQTEDPQFARLRASEAQVWDLWQLEPEETIVEIGPNSRLRVQEVGSGVPVLLVHGTGGYGPYWAPLVAKLGGYRCLMVDRPGWGGSDPVQLPRSGIKRFMSGLLVDVLDRLDVAKVHAVGASIGDNWALSLATEHPDRVLSLALLGGGPLTHEVKIPGVIRLLRSPLGALMSRAPFTQKMETGQARRSGHGPALDDGRMPQAYLDWKVEMTNNTNWRINERRMVRAITRRRGWQPDLIFNQGELWSISVPLLMIYGTADPIATAQTWHAFVDRVPDGHLDLVEGAGHLPWFDNPQQVSESLRTHLGSCND